MQEININVRVQIGVTDTLCSLLSAFAKNAVPGVVAAQPTPAPAQETKPAEAAPVQQAAEVQETEAPAVEAAPVQEPAPAPAPAAAAAPEAEKELTEVDVRAAMDRTRRRIEGENYKEDTSSEGYKKWHRALTGWFKATAALHGADKPSALPDHASRKGFIADCDQVQIKDDQLVGGGLSLLR